MSETFYLKGKTKWFRNQHPNEWGKWSHVLYPDEKSLETIRKLQEEGAKNILRKDEDGYSLSISRPTQMVAKGKVVGLSPPDVFLHDGNPAPSALLVGNGSDITTKIEVYSHKLPGGGRAKAMRWKASRLDNLIPFDKDQHFTPEQEKSRDLLEQPKPLF